MADYTCTSCGAPVAVKNRFSKVIVCDYCGTHMKIQEEGGLNEQGKYPKLAVVPSIFKVGASGTILGKSFSALGFMRYKYSGGHFDEWFLDYDGQPSWFAEDEGTYTLYTNLEEAVDVSAVASLKPGMIFILGGKKVMVKEKGDAEIEGGEGELSFYLEPGTKVSYIEGISEGKKISIEYSEDEVELFSGRVLLRRDIEVR